MSDTDYEGYPGWQNIPTLNFSEREEKFKDIQVEVLLQGFKVGSRVKRKYGMANLGTVVKIHDSASMAYNFHTGIFEPIKVTWDKMANCTGGTYDHNIESLEIVEEEEVEVAVIPFHPIVKKDDLHEDYSNFC